MTTVLFLSLLVGLFHFPVSNITEKGMNMILASF